MPATTSFNVLHTVVTIINTIVGGVVVVGVVAATKKYRQRRASEHGVIHMQHALTHTRATTHIIVSIFIFFAFVVVVVAYSDFECNAEFAAVVVERHSRD
jgi:hypothetical protein